VSNTADRVYTITKDQLPHGWSWATISNLVGKKGVCVDGDWVESKDQDPDGDVRLIQLADIGDGEYRNKSARFLTYLNELDPDKATLFIALMRDQRAQRCLVHSTLAFPSAITPDNAEQLLEEMRLSVAAEVRAEAEKREAELNRKHEDGLTTLVKSHHIKKRCSIVRPSY